MTNEEFQTEFANLLDRWNPSERQFTAFVLCCVVVLVGDDNGNVSRNDLHWFKRKIDELVEDKTE